MSIKSLTDGVTNGVEYLSKRSGFASDSENSSVPGGATVVMGHPMFSGGTAETIQVTVTDKDTQLVSSCNVDVLASAEAAAAKEPSLARGAGSVAALVGAAGAASTLSLLSSMSCGSEEDLPLILHPTGLVVNGNQYFGVIVGNLAIAAGVTLLSYVLVYIIFKCAPGCLPFQQLLSAKGLTRFPSVALFFFLVLYQGTSFASLRLIAYHETAGEMLAGLASTTFCVVVPIVTARIVKSSVPSKGLYKIKEDSSGVESFMLGPGEWVAAEQKDMWHQRYLAMIKPYYGRTNWFACYSFLLAFAVGALNVPEVDSMVQCGHLKLGIGVLFAVMGVFVTLLRPYARYRDNVTYVALHIITSVALFMQAFGFYTEDLNDGKFLTASTLFQIGIMVILVKMAIDLLCDLYVVLVGRRRNLQAKHWAEEAAKNDKEVPLEVVGIDPSEDGDLLITTKGARSSTGSMSSVSQSGGVGRVHNSSELGIRNSGLTASLLSESDKSVLDLTTSLGGRSLNARRSQPFTSPSSRLSNSISLVGIESPHGSPKSASGGPSFPPAVNVLSSSRLATRGNSIAKTIPVVY